MQDPKPPCLHARFTSCVGKCMGALLHASGPPSTSACRSHAALPPFLNPHTFHKQHAPAYHAHRVCQQPATHPTCSWPAAPPHMDVPSGAVLQSAAVKRPPVATSPSASSSVPDPVSAPRWARGGGWGSTPQAAAASGIAGGTCTLPTAAAALIAASGLRTATQPAPGICGWPSSSASPMPAAGDAAAAARRVGAAGVAGAAAIMRKSRAAGGASGRAGPKPPASLRFCSCWPWRCRRWWWGSL